MPQKSTLRAWASQQSASLTTTAVLQLRVLSIFPSTALHRGPLWWKRRNCVIDNQHQKRSPRRKVPREGAERPKFKSMWRKEEPSPRTLRRVINCGVGVISGPLSRRLEDKWMRVTESLTHSPPPVDSTWDKRHKSNLSYGFMDLGVLVQQIEGCLIISWTPVLSTGEDNAGWAVEQDGSGLEALREVWARRKSASPEPRGCSEGEPKPTMWASVPGHPLCPGSRDVYCVGSWPFTGSEHFQMLGTLQRLPYFRSSFFHPIKSLAMKKTNWFFF